MDKLWHRNILWGVILLLATADVTSSNHAIKRSDDTNPLETVVNRLTQDLTRLEGKLQAFESASARRAAFHGVTLVEPNPVTGHAPIKFNVGHQVGGGYDSTTGIYTAPYSGFYTFHTRLYPHDAALFNLDLYQNGDIVSRFLCEDQNSGFTCSSSVTIHVSAGDRMWMQADDFHGGVCYNAQFDNVFSAVLVLPD